MGAAWLNKQNKKNNTCACFSFEQEKESLHQGVQDMEPQFRINQQGSEGCEVIKAETHNKKQKQETVLTEHSKSLEEVENF